MAEGRWLSTALSGTSHLGGHYHASESTVELKQALWRNTSSLLSFGGYGVGSRLGIPQDKRAGLQTALKHQSSILPKAMEGSGAGQSLLSIATEHRA